MRAVARVLASVILLAGCRGGTPAGVGDRRVVDAAAPADMILPAYALTDGPEDPLARRLCAALHDTPARLRARCCTPAAVVVPAGERTADCVRTLSLAIRGGALRLDEAGVAACAAAEEALHAGCAWIGFEPLGLPAACQGAARGRVPINTGCRSSLECAGTAHCEGLGATITGVCRPPRPLGALCEPPVDPLAALLLDDQLEGEHPLCSGHCERGRCATPITPDGPCARPLHCAPGFHCSRQRCVAGWRPRVGDPCDDACEGLARCLGGACVAAAAMKEGAACARDEECAGRCLHPGDPALPGHCSPPCPPTPSP